jgi:multicomponent Na+:H+ antiporter subunit A
LNKLADGVTNLVQGRTLADHASVVLMAAVGMVVYALVTGLGSWAGLGSLFLPWSELQKSMPEVHEVALFVVAIVAALITVSSQPRLNAIISLGVVGIVVTLAFVFFGAPDLALTQLLIEVLTVVLLVLVFYRIPIQARHPLSAFVLVRNLVVSVSVGLLGSMLVVLTAGDSFAPSISEFFMKNSVIGGHGANVVNVILVDFRGYDTLGEITVLSLAALGGYGLLRSSRLRLMIGKLRNEDDETSG